MGPTSGREADAVAFFADLARAPYRHDFYQTLRRLECVYGQKPRWGRALRPIDEPVRLGQDPDLTFAPAPLGSFQAADGAVPRLQVRLFGLFGPNGPLPTHITDYAYERWRNHGDVTLCRFLDIFHHRFLALFYRAWAQAQPHVNHDRPEDDRFMTYLDCHPRRFAAATACPTLRSSSTPACSSVRSGTPRA
jgi:type VI secretion system protein ImpH